MNSEAAGWSLKEIDVEVDALFDEVADDGGGAAPKCDLDGPAEGEHPLRVSPLRELRDLLQHANHVGETMGADGRFQ